MTGTSDEVGHTLDLEAIEARANAATEGPWEVDEPNATYVAARGKDGFYEYICEVDPNQFAVSEKTKTENETNATFIAHARTDIPALVAECRSLRNSHDSLVKALEEIANHPTGGVGCNPVSFVETARAALSQAKGGK